MSIKLTWDDLLIRGFTPTQARESLDEWTWLVNGEVLPLAISKFGSWFLQRRNGCVEVLNVLEGTLSTIANSPDAFYAQMNDRAWQEEHLLSLMVYHLHEDGKVPGPSECYGFAPHPRFTPSLDQERVVILSITVWQTLCSQICRQS